MEPTHTDPRPPMTERELSYHEALAGIAAREAAAAAGGSRHQLRALIHADDLNVERSTLNVQRSTLKGLPLRSDDLLVTLCLGLHAQAFGHDPRAHWADADTARRMTALATLGFLFTRTAEAWDLLDQATDPDASEDQHKTARRAFRLLVTQFAAEFHAPEIEILTRHLLKLAGFHPLADEEPAPQAGELPPPPPPSPPARSWWQALVRLAAGLWRIWRRLWQSIPTPYETPLVYLSPPDSPSWRPVPAASSPVKASPTSTAPSSPPAMPPAPASPALTAS